MHFSKPLLLAHFSRSLLIENYLTLRQPNKYYEFSNHVHFHPVSVIAFSDFHFQVCNAVICYVSLLATTCMIVYFDCIVSKVDIIS